MVASLWVVMAALAAAGGASEDGTVPAIPSSANDNSLYNIWSHALRLQTTPSTKQEIGTLLSPDYFLMINLVPQDVPHPLYSDRYGELRTEFLRDYMVAESVSASDPRMTQPEGLKVTNLNGKELVFKKSSEGNTSVNEIAVTSMETLSDGITSYTLKNFLFDHRARVDVAFKELMKVKRRYGAFGQPLDRPF